MIAVIKTHYNGGHDGEDPQAGLFRRDYMISDESDLGTMPTHYAAGGDVDVEGNILPPCLPGSTAWLVNMEVSEKYVLTPDEEWLPYEIYRIGVSV